MGLLSTQPSNPPQPFPAKRIIFILAVYDKKTCAGYPCATTGGGEIRSFHLKGRGGIAYFDRQLQPAEAPTPKLLHVPNSPWADRLSEALSEAIPEALSAPALRSTVMETSMDDATDRLNYLQKSALH